MKIDNDDNMYIDKSYEYIEDSDEDNYSIFTKKQKKNCIQKCNITINITEINFV
jgi:hypothetical protein